MLAKKTKIKKVFLEDPRKSTRFCTRSGMISFTKNDLLTAVGTNTCNITPSNFIPISTKTLDCMRIFFADLQGFQIPQLSLYAPLSGYPLCRPDYVSKYIASGNWPKKLAKYFVTIPIAHIGHGLFNNNPLHQYSVYLSKDLWSRDREIHMNPFTKESFKYRTGYESSKIFPFSTDLNNPDEIKGHMFPHTGVSERVSQLRLDFDHELCFLDSGDYTSRVLDDWEFDVYLAWWMFYYPHKWISLKNTSISTTGSDTSPFEGYVEYYPIYNNGNYFGTAKPHSTYYSTGLPLRLAPRMLIPKATEFQNVFTWDMAGLYSKEETYDVIEGISKAGFRAMAAIRCKIESDLELKPKHNFYPFKKFKQSFGPGRKTFLNSKGLKVFSTISQIRKYLQDEAIAVALGDSTCPKCRKALIVPRLLAMAKPKVDTLICLECGYKYLTNMFNAFCNKDKFLMFEGYPLSEVTVYKELAMTLE